MLDLASRLQPYDHIIWDWNGTLLDDIDIVLEVLHDLVEEYGLKPINKDEYRAHFGFPVINFYERMGFDLSKDCFDAISKKYIERYLAAIPSCNLTNGARDLLEHLHQQQKTVSILSAAKQDILEANLHHFNITHLFHHIFGIDNVYAHSKVARGHELMLHCQLPVERTMLVGDTDHDYEVAKALGIDVILVTHGHQSKERLLACHDQIFTIGE